MKKLLITYAKIITICLFISLPNLSYGYECTISGSIYNLHDGVYVPNHLVVVSFLDTTIIDSIFTNINGYYKKTYQIEDSGNDNISYYFEVKTQDPCNSDNIYSFNQQTYAGIIENLDFEVCDNYEYCVADFDWYDIAKNTVQFIDYSYSWYEIKSWFWNFGDGETSNEQHPIHIFSESGYYSVGLTIISEDTCEAFTSYTIYIEPEKTLEGMVYASGYPLPKGRVYAYTLEYLNSNYELVLNTSFSVEAGHFTVTYLYLEPSLLYVIPEFDLGEFYYPMYFPTYFHNELNDSAYYWEYNDNYSQISDSIAIINLVKYDDIFYGHCTVSGTIDLDGYELSNAQEICVLLLNENKKPVKYTFASNDNFELNNIPFGNYYLLVDVVGIPSKPRFISLTENNPDININFSIINDSLTNVQETIIENELKITPNPFINELIIGLKYSLEGKSELTIYNISGQLVYNKTIQQNTLNQRINLNHLPEGTYIATLLNKDMIYTQKLVKLNH
ncbi:MAG: T9SS type A sorting domain-containing protein [Salinivirgaceae bacterium]|nr:T9SS type A sorting domain-containing protein [Salinivirgaceae bacterium]